MQRRTLGLGTFGLMLSLLFAERAIAVPVTLVADTHVNAARPAVNSGAISNIDVGGGYTGLVQFDFGVLPAGISAAQVSRAVLRLYVNQVTSAGTVSAEAVTSAWSEYGVTYQTMPSLGSVAGTLAVSQAGAYITLDVTALVQAWLSTPAMNHGLALTSESALAQFDSKENDLTAHAPSLDVELVGQAGAAGLPGPAGPVGAQGAVGAPGVPGPFGPAGPAGSSGPVGPQGLPGPAGAMGPLGPQGAAGPAGAAGSAGAAGQTGATGPAGPAGVAGAAGSAGAQGAQGVAGPPGATGSAGPAGPQGLTGAAGPPVSFRGTWTTGSSYVAGEAVSFAGSSYVALQANAGQQPDQSTGVWSLLAQVGGSGPQGLTGTAGVAGAAGPAGPQGSSGPTGPAGAAGPAGPQGVAGTAGAAGPAGPAGAAGINFRGAWAGGYGYATNDAVTAGGATWLALVANNSIAPGSDATTWTVLAAAGGAGPTGAAGPAATVTVGTVATGAAGSSASVVNSGTASAAVLNFTIPQGAAGTGSGSGSGSGTSGIPFASMYHAVSYAATFYSLTNTNQSLSESAAVATWVPDGCSATRLVVYSQQAATITVTLRVGLPGNMASSTLTCQAATGQSCSAIGAVAIPAGNFADLEIDHADSNPLGVWTAVSCN